MSFLRSFSLKYINVYDELNIRACAALVKDDVFIHVVDIIFEINPFCQKNGPRRQFK